MNLYNKEVQVKKLPFDLKDCRKEIGIIRRAILKCPGVYYVTTSQTEKNPCGLELFIVTDGAPISNEARSFGMKLPSHPDLLLYRFGAENCYDHIIRYELARFYKKHNLPLSEDEDIYTCAIYGMESCPDYFGTFPVPNLTPWGYTLRHKILHNGVYWIEAENCESLLAIHHILCDDITEETCARAEQTDYDKEHGVENTNGFNFFQGDAICLVLFELMTAHQRWDWSLINRAALMNAIWAQSPEYAAEHNLREQRGGGDLLGLIMKEINPYYELEPVSKEFIEISLDAGLEFFVFRKTSAVDCFFE